MVPVAWVGECPFVDEATGRAPEAGPDAWEALLSVFSSVADYWHEDETPFWVFFLFNENNPSEPGEPAMSPRERRKGLVSRPTRNQQN